MNQRLLLLLALLGVGTFGLAACPGNGGGDDDDSGHDDDHGDDDDSAGDDDDATGDDDDATGDDDDATGDDDDATSSFSITEGVWDDGFSKHAVTEHAWITWSDSGVSRYDISQLEAEFNFAVAQNSANNEYFPGLWSRFEWLEEQGAGYYCQSAYDAADEESVDDVAVADPSDLSAGCGGFGWSALTADTAALAISGVHVDEYGGDNLITSGTWTVTNGTDVSTFAITQYDNAAGYAIAQNGAENAFNANAWSRFDFVEYEGSWYACTTAYDAVTESDALNTAASDSSDPAAGGCGGSFPWTNLTP